MKKESYFQGGGGENEPTPKKKKYKSDKAIVVQPRFKEPLYRNYYLYETEGVDGPAKHGPGTGLYQSMKDYKSVSEFLKKRRERNKDKYKADDSYIEDDWSITKSKIAERRAILSQFFKKEAIDFPVDEFIGSGPILGNLGTVSDSIPIGGQTDEYLTMPDAEGKLPNELNFGRDYAEDPKQSLEYIKILQKILDELSLAPAESDLLGMPQGISPKEDLDSPSNKRLDYGITDSGNTIYNKK